MADKATFDTLLDTLVLLIPVAIALTLIFLLWSRRRHRRAPPPEMPERPGEMQTPQYAISQPIVGDTPAVAAEVPAPKAIESAAEPETKAKTESESADMIIEKIEDAISNGPKTSLSGLYFDLAAAHERDGKLDARMSALRSAAGYGALHGPPAAHAAARLMLGEVAHQAGDLTSACEQWQLARTAFLEGGDAEQHARVEKRMRDNGCPTDWVLTDF